MGSHEIYYTLPTGDRALKRKELISKMLEEDCGTGTGDNCSRYTYFVESYDEYSTPATDALYFCDVPILFHCSRYFRISFKQIPELAIFRVFQFDSLEFCAQ